MRRTFWLISTLLGAAGAVGTPAGTTITNVAYMDTADGGTKPSNPVTVTVIPVCGVTITPAEQRLPGKVGVENLFTFTITNTGNAPFTFPLSVRTDADAQASVNPTSVKLLADESQNVQVSLVSDEPGVKKAVLSTGCGDSTVTGTALTENSRDPMVIVKKADVKEAKPGDTVMYTITVTNPNKAPVKNFVVTDTLDADLMFVDSVPAPEVKGQTLNYLIPIIPAEGTLNITIRAKISSTKDDMVIPNVAILKVPNETPIPTPPVVVDVWDGKLSIKKDVDKMVARVGDKLNYAITVTNTSLNAAFKTVRIVDRLPAELLVDAATLQLNGKPVQDLNPDPLIIEVEDGPLAAQQKMVLSYRASVLPAAVGKGVLRNVALAEGTPDARTPKPPVKTPEVDSVVRVVQDNRATLIGRVYFDRNGNKTFDDGDTPINHARIMIAGIGSVLTDEQGRYGILDLREARYGMQLDLSSVSGQPMQKGGDYALGGARLSNVYGLTVEDFPIKPPSGQINAWRDTKVFTPERDITIYKTVEATSQGYQVTLSVQASRDVTVSYQDVLPQGASLLSGDLSGELQVKAGTIINVTYFFTGNIPSEARMTDPNIQIQEAAQ